MRASGLLLVALVNTITLAGSGCHVPARSYQPQVNCDELDDVRFLHYLADVPTVTLGEGARAVLMLSYTAGELQTFDARAAELVRLGAVQADWKEDPADTLTMGTLAMMLAAVCDVPAGIDLRVSERTGIGRRRYALRACVDAELLPYATPNQPVRGGELMTAISRCSEQAGANDARRKDVE